jgi:4'-phosphopantetheinyl transferase
VTPIALPANDEIHVWSARLDDPAAERNDFGETLTTDERDRAARFHFEKHRRRYIAGRTALRCLIGSYLQVKAAEIRFDYAGQGKPILAWPKFAGLEFNVSHSGNLALFAFAFGAPIGVDVEVIRPFPNLNDVARRFFSALEYDMLQQAAPELRLEAFFNCWTRKEAYIKAEGQGLSIPLDSFTVSVAPGAPARFVQLNSGNPDAWTLHHLKPASDAVGAVAIPALNRKLVLRDVSPSVAG